MKYTISAALFLSFSGSLLAAAPANAQVDARALASNPPVSGAVSVSTSTRARVLEKYAQLPLRFEANQGQTDQRVRFLSRGSGYMLFLTPTGAVVSVSEPVGGSSDPQHPGFSLTHNRTSSFRMELSGANPDAAIAGSDELPGRSNYFFGNDPKQWHTGVPAFGRVNYKDIYPGVDLVYYGNQRQLEYDFVVAPGADPKGIKLRVSGSRHIRSDNNGDVLIRVGDREFRLGAPVVYQEYEGKRHPIAGKWLRSSRQELRFGLGAYDHSRALIVDPTLVLVYSTFLGGSAQDEALGVAVDSNGDAYITGFTGSTNFPVTPNALQQVCNGCTGNGTNNAFVSEIDPTGTVLVYSTYLGGSNGDGANGIAVDANENAYIVGTTFSGGAGGGIAFPTTTGAFQTVCAGGCTSGDAFVSEIQAGGGGLIFSTFLGGTGKDTGNAIALDFNNNVYVVGSTASTDFPTSSPIQAANAGGTADAFVTKFTSSGSILGYSTYLGGTLEDAAYAIAVDESLNAYVAGVTYSTNFPTVSPLQAANAGNGDGFVAKLNSKGSALTYSTYLGGTALDQINGIALDSADNVYTVGTTSSGNFPTKTPFQSTCASCSLGPSDAFVAQINTAGSTLVYSTYLGGNGLDLGLSVAVDTVGNAFVSGQTASTDFPVANYPNYSFNTCSSCSTGGHDAFVTEFDVAGNALVYSSYLGGTTSQSAYGITVNANDQAIVAGATASANFPVTSGVVQSTYGGGTEDAFLTSFPASANCTNSYTQADTLAGGSTINITLSCYGNFFLASTAQFLGYDWGDNTQQTGSGDGCPASTGCIVTAGNATFPASHPYASNGSYSGTNTVTDGSGNNIITTGFSVTIPLISITPANLPGGNVGTTYSQTLTGSGGTTPYTWSITAGSLAPLTLSSTTGAILGTPTTAGTLSFTVQAKDANGNTTPQAFSIVITSALIITTQPASQTINSGQTATMTVAATGGTGTLTYQWYLRSSGVTTSPISGATLSSYTTPDLTTTTSYWVQVKDGGGNTVNSSTAIITVVPPLTITTQPASQTIGSGQTATMTVVATGGTGTLTYQWYQGSSGVTTSPISGATLSSYTTPDLTATTSYWVQVKDGGGHTANSNTATITVTTALTITTQPASQTINSGQTATMSVVATGGTGTLTYQWYEGSSGVTTNLISGATLSSYTTPALTATTSYWVQVKDGGGHSVNSNTATITVSTPTPPSITTQPASQTINAGQTAKMTVTATGSSPLTYQWYLGSSGDLTSPITGATLASYTTPALTATASYWVQVTNSAGSAASNTATITVVAPPTCAPPTVTVGTNSLSVTATSNCSDSGSTITSTSIDWGDDSSPFSGTSGAHAYASGGTFTITVTATNANNLSSNASATVTVSAPVPTPVPQGQPMAATVNVVAPPGGDITVTYSCTSADGPEGTQPLSAYYLTGCTVTGPDNSSTMTLTDTPQPVTVSVNTTGPTPSQSAARSGRLGGLYSAFLFLPGIVLLGVGFSRPLRGKSGRYASAALLGLMMLSWLACGGGSIAPPPNQNITPSGSYGINVTGTSSSGTTVTITVGFTVTIG